MIASSYTIRALLIATVAVVGSANDSESSTLLRGNSIKQAQEAVDVAARRSLVSLDMTIGLGEMICEEHPRLDGSVVCSFRTMPPTDMVSNTIQKDCLYTTTSDTNFCLATQVNRVPFNYQIPDASDVTQDVIIVQPVKPVRPGRPVRPDRPFRPVIGTCPVFQPNSGLACSTYIPLGLSESSCTYGQMKCNCELQNNNRNIPVGWDCFLAPEDTNGGGTGIDLIPNAEVISPTNAPVQINRGQILPNIINPAGCPKTKPNDGVSCNWGQRCHYYEKSAIGNTLRSLNCDCDGDCEFRCRTRGVDQYPSF